MKKVTVAMFVWCLIPAIMQAYAQNYKPNRTPSYHTSVSTNPVLLEPTRPVGTNDYYSDYGLMSSQNCERSTNNIVAPDHFNSPCESDGENKNCQYSSNAEIAALSANELIVFLKSTSEYECHAGILFNYEPQYSPLIFANEKIQAVANEISTLAADYDGTFASGIYGLICYIHVAQYFSFYNSSTISINGNSFNAIEIATDALSVNPALFDLNEEAPVILEEFLIILDFTGLRHRATTISLIKQIMANMVIYDTWKNTPDISWVTGYWRIYSLMFRGCTNNDTNYLTTIANDSEFMELWGSVCNDLEIMDSPEINVLYQNNAITEMARVVTKEDFPNLVCPDLYTVTTLFPRLHINWITAVNAINLADQCVQYNLCEDPEELKSELELFLFPNTFYYNDSSLIFRAKFTKEIADNLFYATRQVESQFFRLVQSDQPVEGDTNTVLTCTVFESQQVYENYVTYLYGIPSNNGGMYLEQPCMFYTWDRPASFGLTLEDLFRHEFTHYLQGRYLIPGYWGVNPFYNNERLTWYEEGHAEFLCASTDFEGIKLKTSTINTLSIDHPVWPTLENVLSSYYGQEGSIFYPYGNLMWFNWYLNDYGMIKIFHDLTRDNDITGFDDLVDSLKNSTAAELQWQSFLMDTYTNNSGYQNNTNWISDQYLTVSLLNDIQNEFSEITGIVANSTTLEATSSINRFRISFDVTGTEPVSNITDGAIKINQELDSLLVQLKNNQYINNFDYTTGYFTNLTLDDNIPSAIFNIQGSLRDPAISDDPVANFTFDRSSVLTEGQIHFESSSLGYIKDYQWSFSGGTPSVSNEKNPIISYNTEGTYDVALTVIGKTPEISDTKTLSSIITVYAQPSGDYCSATNVYDYAWIANVELSDISNPTNGFPSNGYSDFSTSIATELLKGSTYPISVDLSYTNSPNRNIAVWIDFNNNNSFEDEGEQVLLAQPPQAVQLTGASISIPLNATMGSTRMRVRANYLAEGNISPCGNDDYMGETEDYAVIISGQPELSLSLPSGWSDLSTFIIPSEQNIEILAAQLDTNLVILQHFSEVYWPEAGVNSLVNWDYKKGYLIKLNTSQSISISGTPAIGDSLAITQGWNLIPALCSQCFAIPEMLGENTDKVKIIRDGVGLHVYWPEAGVYTLNQLLSGRAYYLYATEPFMLFF